MQTNISLASLTTMRLGGLAAHVVELTKQDDLPKIIEDARTHALPFFVLSGGSNVIATDEGYDGVLILNKLNGFEIISDNESQTTVKIAAGENWDETVERTVEMGLSGIEAMSAIPGSVGATPVQNVGAYGQEIADTLIELEAYDTDSSSWVTLQNDECHFTYRNSIFKDPSTRHHIITSITLKLNKTPMQPPFYASLEQYLHAHDSSDFSPASIRNAVIDIRAIKLPDPTVVANTGSFFKNPFVEAKKAEELNVLYPDLPSFPMKDGSVKLAAGWLIEFAGLKGTTGYGFKTYEYNALVVVNESATSYQELKKFKSDIIAKVESKFGVTLEQEPELLLNK